MNYISYPFHFTAEGGQYVAYFDVEFLMNGETPTILDFKLVELPEEAPISPGEIYSLFDAYLERGSADWELRNVAKSWGEA